MSEKEKKDKINEEKEAVYNDSENVEEVTMDSLTEESTEDRTIEKVTEEAIEETKAEATLTDEEIEQALQKMTEDVQIPESLSPEAIEKKLEESGAGKKKKTVWWKYASLAAAACVCAVVGLTAMNRGLSGNGNSEEGMLVSDATSEDGAASEEMSTAKDYDEIYAAVKEYNKKMQESYDSKSSADTAKEIALESAESADSAAKPVAQDDSASASDTGHSDTNVREDGVGEGDVVKTDGKNLYFLNRNRISIVGIDNGSMTELAVIKMENECYASDLYVQDGKLVVVYTKTEYGEEDEWYYKNSTCAEVYDVSNPAKPKSIGKISQSGSYNTMRVKDGSVYLLSDYYVTNDAKKKNVSWYVPEVQGKVMDAGDVYMPFDKMGNEYTVISSFSLSDPENKVDSKAVFGYGSICYVSQKNIYITESDYNDNDENVTRTAIRKVSYKDGELKGVAQTKIKGTLNDSFSIDEYDGNLRVVTTVSDLGGDNGVMPLFGARSASSDDVASVEEQQDYNALYVLDEKLQIIGEISDLALDETVYSARFMGEIGYFVTYKQMDPLFSVDLSDPKNPKILGELKIPGFSEYLHPYGEGKLLGIGMDVDEEGVTTSGVKISMFDTSDPSDVKEKDKLVIEDTYSTDVSYNYKAAFIDTEKNLIGFKTYGDGEGAVYRIYSYDVEKGFTEVFEAQTNYDDSIRGLYVGNVFYLVDGNTVRAYDMTNFEKIDDIVL